MAENKSSNQNMLAALTYLLGFITGIVFLLIEKKNKFIRFHAMQSVILFGGLFVVNIAIMYLGSIGDLLAPILSLASFILWIVLMVKAYQGQMFKLPYIGEVAENQTK